MTDKPRFTFNELYDKADEYPEKEVDRDHLRSISRSRLDQPAGTLLRTFDNANRRVVILVGGNQNIVVFDRYPDLRTKMFMYYAPAKIEQKLHAILSDQDMEFLVDSMYLI